MSAEQEQIELNEDCLPWHQQPGEPDKAFQHFLRFLGLGFSRSLVKYTETIFKQRIKDEETDERLQERLIAKLQGAEGVRGTSAANEQSVYQYLRNLSSRYLWQKRAMARDQYDSEKLRSEHNEAVRIMHLRHASLAEKMHETALAKLQARLENMPDEHWSPEDIRKWANDGVKLERLSMGEAETIQENQHSVGNLEGLSIDARKALFEKFAVGRNAPPKDLNELSGGQPIITRDDTGDRD